MLSKQNGVSLKTWKEYAELYCVDPNLSSHTLKTRENVTGKVESFCKEEGITFIDTKTILRFRQSLCGYSYNTVAKYIRQIHSFCVFMIESGVLKETLVPRSMRVKERYDELKPILRPEDVKRLVTSTRLGGMSRSAWCRNKAICLLAMSSGMRRGELLAMRAVDVHPETNSISVPSGKGRKGRTVSVIPMALDAMSEYQRLYRPKQAKDDDPFFCRVVDGEVVEMSPRTIEAAMRSHIEVTTGRTDITPHCLRHSYASYLANANIPILEIMHVLGHSSLTQTARYLQMLGTPTEAVNHASEAINRVMSPKYWGNEKEPSLFD